MLSSDNQMLTANKRSQINKSLRLLIWLWTNIKNTLFLFSSIMLKSINPESLLSGPFSLFNVSKFWWNCRKISEVSEFDAIDLRGMNFPAGRKNRIKNPFQTPDSRELIRMRLPLELEEEKGRGASGQIPIKLSSELPSHPRFTK